MRIGTNHGSLSDRILSRYGDTPKGMVESAMEFLRICRDENYFDIILSMKASNTRVMVQAYRLLVARNDKRRYELPTTFRSNRSWRRGEDGRIKSAVGIGTLLADGIGDTIRVSLTEAPEFEIPVAKKILSHFKEFNNHKLIADINKNPLKSFSYLKRVSNVVLNIGGKNAPIVQADLSSKAKITPASFFALRI